MLEPAATVTLVGATTYVGFELARLTARPPLPAAEVNVTVPVLPLPPTTVDGESVRLAMGVRTVRVACCLSTPTEAVMVALNCDG